MAIKEEVKILNPPSKNSLSCTFGCGQMMAEVTVFKKKKKKQCFYQFL